MQRHCDTVDGVLNNPLLILAYAVDPISDTFCRLSSLGWENMVCYYQSRFQALLT